MRGLTSCFQFIFNNQNDVNLPPNTCVYHDPPPVVDHTHNPTVFGKILSGQLPSRDHLETTELLAFHDRWPKAKLHALVIPKCWYKSVYSLTPVDDVNLIQDMTQMGHDILKEQQPQALANEDYILCFHIPPFYSVAHLHLHVLAPASEMNFLNRYIKFQCGTRWCISCSDVLERLKSGQMAVPYKQFF